MIVRGFSACRQRVYRENNNIVIIENSLTLYGPRLCRNRNDK